MRKLNLILLTVLALSVSVIGKAEEPSAKAALSSLDRLKLSIKILNGSVFENASNNPNVAFQNGFRRVEALDLNEAYCQVGIFNGEAPITGEVFWITNTDEIPRGKGLYGNLSFISIVAQSPHQLIGLACFSPSEKATLNEVQKALKGVVSISLDPGSKVESSKVESSPDIPVSSDSGSGKDADEWPGARSSSPKI